ncbi:MAG: inositol monophosphatase [Pseudomonadota bacterium]
MPDQLPMPVTAPLTSAQKTTVLNLVRRAGRAEILPRFRKLDRGEILTKTGPTDLVTAADHGAEAMIARGLQMAFPSALIVGEEAAEHNADLIKKLPDTELAFLIDPVDGTWNFAHGLPVFSTMVAACRFGQPVFGLIYDPIGDDALVSDNEGPARRHTAAGLAYPLAATNGIKPLSEMTGYMSPALMEPADRALATARMAKFGMVTNLRCSAYEYRLLAEGAVDFVLSAKLKPWDHAAGVVLCRKSGGHSAMLDGSDYVAGQSDGFLLSASSAATWQAVRDIFADLLGDD